MTHSTNTIRLFNEHIYVIGDLHLGDGTRSDAFSLGDSVTKRDRMRALIKEIRENDGILIINGDWMDLQQGWSIDRVITANAILFRELSDLGKEGKLIYIWSELDEDLSYYEELLNAQTASNVLVLEREPVQTVTENQDKDEHPEKPSSDMEHPREEQNDNPKDTPNDTEEIEHDPIVQANETEQQKGTVTEVSDDTPVWAELVQGFRFNPRIKDLDSLSLRGKSTHHLIERLLGTWIRFPLENFPTLENKVFFWLLHKLDWLGQKLNRSNLRKLVACAHANQIGNPHQVWTELHRQIQAEEFKPQAPLLIMGHSHLPGVVPLSTGETTLINTGSWIFDSQTVLHLEPKAQQHTLFDWESKDEIHGEPFAHLSSTHPMDRATTNSSFSLWWKQHYQGWLKFTFQSPLPSVQTNPSQNNTGDS